MRNPGEPLRDHPVEMRSHHGPTDEAIDALLDGTPSQELAGTPLADLVERIRTNAATTEPTPSTELASLMAHGLAPTEKGDLPATAGSNATASTDASWLPKWTRSAAMFRKLIIAKLAALGVVVKAGAAGAAVVVTAAGVGAAGQLPAPAQTAFDRIAEQGEDVDDEEIEDEQLDALEEVEEVEEDSVDSVEDDTEAEGPAEACETREAPGDDADFGDVVSWDAMGCEEGDEPGVDGQEISEMAKERARQRAEERGFGGPPAEGEKPGPPEGVGADAVGDDDDLSDDLSDDEVSDSVDSVDSDDSDGDGPPEGVPSGPPASTPAGPPADGGEG